MFGWIASSELGFIFVLRAFVCVQPSITSEEETKKKSGTETVTLWPSLRRNRRSIRKELSCEL